MFFGLYTMNYEDYRQVFFTTIGRHICYAAVDFNRTGVDNANYVHDEVLAKLWCQFW